MTIVVSKNNSKAKKSMTIVVSCDMDAYRHQMSKFVNTSQMS